MAKKKLHIASVLAMIMAVAAGCSDPSPEDTPEQPDAPSASTGQSTFSIKGNVREMFIPAETIEFPEHKGKQEFVLTCAKCHSLRYILTQPNFPRKTWAAEVKKMVDKFGAPVDSVTAQKITDYLVTIKGIPD